ncbi:MAG: DNA-3-methyladenine glycosylase [Nitrolancea sp.]
MSQQPNPDMGQFQSKLALPVDWYERYVVDVARDLLGCVIVSDKDGTRVAGHIVETEAYDGQDDPASHSAFRRSGVVRAMWGPRGSLYVYRAYGMYPCFNVVAGPGTRPSAVLIRAIEAVEDVSAMSERTRRPSGAKVASGPGLTGRALAIDLDDNGHALQESPIWIQAGAGDVHVVTGPRIGITRGVDAPWRFGIAGHPSLSKRFH